MPLVPGGFSSYDNMQDLSDSQYFWSHLVSFGYQSGASEDGDPNGETPLYGGTPKIAVEDDFSAILVEALRDEWASQNANVILPGPQQNLQIARERYWSLIAGTVAHESGHSPGGQSDDDDHAEGEMMGDDHISLGPFYPPTIIRFRKARSWLP